MPTPTDEWGQSPSSLPSINDKELLKRYRMRVESVQKWRDSEGYDSTWRRMRDLYRFQVFDAFSDEDRVHVAVAFATINVIEPSVAINHPHLTVSARSDLYAAQATIAEAAVNYWWEVGDIHPEFRSAVKDYLIYGHGWLKVGYRYVEEQVPVGDAAVNAQIVQMVQQADQAAIANPAIADQLPTNEQIIASVPTTTTHVVEDRAFVERVSPFDMFVDPDGTSLSNIEWLVQRVVRPLEDVKTDSRYNSRVRSRLQSDGSTEWHLEESRHNVTAERERITLWEFYDLKRHTMCVFTESGEGFLVDPTPMPYMYGAPFVMLRDYDVPDQFYPIGELEALEPLQYELNETRSAMVRARKLSIRKYFVRKDAMTPDGIRALKSDQDNAVIVVEDNTPFDQIIGAVPSATIQPELYNHSDTILADVDRVSAISDYQRGQLPEIRRTATEASIIQDASNARAADKLAQIERAASEVGRRLVQLAQQYMSQDAAARIVGRDGQTFWFQYGPEDIEGEFDFSVTAGSMKPKNDAFKRQQAQELAGAMMPFIQMGVVNPYMVALELLRSGFDIGQPERFMVQAPPPGAPQDPNAPPQQGGQQQGPPQPGGPQQGPPQGPQPAGPPQDPNAPPSNVLTQTVPQLQGQVGLDTNTLQPPKG